MPMEANGRTHKGLLPRAYQQLLSTAPWTIPPRGLLGKWAAHSLWEDLLQLLLAVGCSLLLCLSSIGLCSFAVASSVSAETVCEGLQLTLLRPLDLDCQSTLARFSRWSGPHLCLQFSDVFLWSRQRQHPWLWALLLRIELDAGPRLHTSFWSLLVPSNLAVQIEILVAIDYAEHKQTGILESFRTFTSDRRRSEPRL